MTVWHEFIVCCTKFNIHFKLFMTTLPFFIIVIVAQTHVNKNTSKKEHPHSCFSKYILGNKDFDAFSRLPL